MNKSVSEIDIQQLRADLDKQLQQPLLLKYHHSCASTNSECMQNIPDSEQQSIVVISEQQTSGRGRRGKVWHSPAGLNIYCSIGLYVSLDARYIGLISLQVGVCIARVLRQQGYKDVQLKWPNDLLCEGKKLGGILIESRVIETNKFYLVIGFGLNVNQDMAQLDTNALSEIDQPAISLMQIEGKLHSRQTLLSQLVPYIITATQQLDASIVESLLQQFSALDSLQGRSVQVKTLKLNKAGKYLGITDNGQVRIQTDEGVELFSSAEISLREAIDVTH